MSSRTCLVLGDVARCEFAPLRDRLQELTDSGHLAIRQTADVGEALSWLRDPGWTAELALVLQEYPGEFPAAAAGELLGAAPLCRWICCAGVWCESELRHGSCWPAAIHVPVRLAAQRTARELEVLAGTARPLPLTGGADEVFAADSEDANRATASWQPDGRTNGAPTEHRGIVRVSSPDRCFRAYAAEVLRGAGFITREAPLHQLPDAGANDCLLVLDLDPRGIRHRAEWPATAVPVLGLMALPTPGDYRQAAGAADRLLMPKLAAPSAIREAARQLTDRRPAPC